MKFLLFVLLITAMCFDASAIEVSPLCPTKPVDEESTLALASTWFKKGQKEVEAKRYDAAVEAFGCSLSMVEHHATLYNAGQAAMLAKNYEVAKEMGTRILELAPDENQKNEGQELLAAAAQAMSKEKKEPVPVKELEQSGPPVSTPKEKARKEQFKQSKPKATNTGALWKVGLVSTLTAGAALIAGGALQGLAGHAQKTTGQTDDLTEYEKAENNIGKFQTGATVSFIVGGALLVTGVSLLVAGRKKSDKTELSLVPCPQGLVLMGRF